MAMNFEAVATACAATSDADILLINKITARAVEIAEGVGVASFDQGGLAIDLTLTHHRCPLDLEALLNADASNFIHDVFGIRNEINRETGDLGCFMPRFAKGDK